MKKFIAPEMTKKGFDAEDILTTSSVSTDPSSEDVIIPTQDPDEGVII